MKDLDFILINAHENDSITSDLGISSCHFQVLKMKLINFLKS